MSPLIKRPAKKKEVDHTEEVTPPEPFAAYQEKGRVAPVCPTCGTSWDGIVCVVDGTRPNQ